MKLASPFSSLRDEGFQGELFRLVSLLIPEEFLSEVFSKNYCRSLPFGQFAQAGLSRAVARVSPLLRILSGWSTTNLFPCLLFGLAGLEKLLKQIFSFFVATFRFYLLITAC